MLYIKNNSLVVLVLLTMGVHIKSMDNHRIQEYIVADLQISRKNIMCYIGEKEFEHLDRFGIPTPDVGSLMPAVKVDCFAQRRGKEFNWTKGKFPYHSAFPRYIPLNILWGLESDSCFQLQTQEGLVEVNIRDNFSVPSDFSEQLMDSLDKFLASVNICSCNNATDKARLIAELENKRLIRKKLIEIEEGVVTPENPVLYVHCPVSNRCGFEYLFNEQKRLIEMSEVAQQASISGSERKKIISKHVALNPVFYLMNRETALLRR